MICRSSLNTRFLLARAFVDRIVKITAQDSLPLAIACIISGQEPEKL